MVVGRTVVGRNTSNEHPRSNALNRGTLARIPNIRIMAVNRKVVTIHSLDGDIGAVGGEIVNEVVASSQQSSPAILQRVLVQTGIIQALLKLVCKYQFQDEDSQNKLFEIMDDYFNGKKPRSEEVEANVSLSIKLQQYFEKAIKTAKSGIENGKTTLLLNPTIMLNEFFGSLDSSVILLKTPKYCEIFSNIKKIGKGGGGRVYEGKHKVDQCYYAIKIIPLPVKEKWEEALKEAVYLAKLDHPNVVTYKTAWIDHCTDKDCLGSSESSPVSNANELSGVKSTNADCCETNLNDITFKSECSDLSVVFEKSESIDVPSASSKQSRSEWQLERFMESSRKLLRSTSYEEPKLRSAVVKYKHNFGHQGQGDGANFVRGDFLKPPCDPCQTVLIIQMELCSSTLKDLLDKRVESLTSNDEENKPDAFTLVDETKMLEILRFALEGIQYCHDAQFIHRDLKPSNIFIDKNGKVKIGDFGLATTKLLNEESPNNTSCQTEYTSNIGTRPYAAPEQLNGTKYNYKVDMYSLGIIIIELFHPFTTGMERVITFKSFKDGIAPEKFQKRWPKQASLILKLLSDDPSKRPDAREILRSDLFHQRTSDSQFSLPKIIITQHNDIDDMDFESLKLYAKNLEKENCSLKQRVFELEHTVKHIIIQ